MDSVSNDLLVRGLEDALILSLWGLRCHGLQVLQQPDQGLHGGIVLLLQNCLLLFAGEEGECCSPSGFGFYLLQTSVDSKQ